ncbi:hypothetical protein [Pseudemcibacter aquimaris]|uniref:hypothetical protein n=1 Tax=Pseudemcibacter aquimaris TaxID=2857064 RepID=UPI0020139D4E|nr:hypothetical protein [Pseudemcibacter aquimaris]MCC3859759.1 hypothetical protein [Pseudemcibacter aquimaris]WDU60153.1 hypothetical protein KW060_07770 [Pseudemcibacter aquimaris]
MFEKVKSMFGSKPEPKRKVRKTVRKQQDIPVQVEEAATPADIKLGKELFWGRYPHYPEMSTVYRKIFQKYNVDNTRTIKVHDAICGTDMCNISAGNGPNVEYICDDDKAKLVEGHIRKLGLTKKFERVYDADFGDAKSYIAHVFTFYPELDAESKIDWQALDDNTMPGGFVFLPRLVTNPKEADAKPSDKLADNIPFYHYINMDHTDHWIEVLTNKVTMLQNNTPEKLETASKAAVQAFRDEVTKWALEIKRLKSEDVKIITTVYKHDDA